MTLVEVAIGIAVLGVISLVTAGMLKAGTTTYNYTMGQLVILRRSRQALDTPGAAHGISWALRGAKGISTLSSEHLTLEPASGPLVRYHLADGSLLATQTGVAAKQAEGIESVEFKYYRLDEMGRLVESPSADGVALVTATLKVKGGRKQFVTFTAAALRNR